MNLTDHCVQEMSDEDDRPVWVCLCEQTFWTEEDANEHVESSNTEHAASTEAPMPGPHAHRWTLTRVTDTHYVFTCTCGGRWALSRWAFENYPNRWYLVDTDEEMTT